MPGNFLSKFLKAVPHHRSLENPFPANPKKTPITIFLLSIMSAKGTPFQRIIKAIWLRRLADSRDIESADWVGSELLA